MSWLMVAAILVIGVFAGSTLAVVILSRRAPLRHDLDDAISESMKSNQERQGNGAPSPHLPATTSSRGIYYVPHTQQRAPNSGHVNLPR